MESNDKLVLGILQDSRVGCSWLRNMDASECFSVKEADSHDVDD